MRTGAVLVPVAVLALSFTAPPAQAAQQTTRISVSSAGVQANNHSQTPMISADGSRVVFVSTATNLVAGGSTGFSTQVYVHDRLSGNVQRASVSSSGAIADANCSAPSISATGRYVVFTSKALNLAQPVASSPFAFDNVFLRDLSSGTTTLVSVAASGGAANSASVDASVSSDGRFVAFISYATNLVAPTGPNTIGVYLRDMLAGTTTRVSVPTNPMFPDANAMSLYASISDSGDWVVFSSHASNLIPGDVNGREDVFLYSRLSGTLTGVTVNPPSFVGNGSSFDPRISDTGDFVIFTSSATNLTPGDFSVNDDVFVWERATNTFKRASEPLGGGGTSFGSGEGAVSSDGVFATFYSYASNLVPGDSNVTDDVFRKNLVTGAVERLSVSSNGQQSLQGSYSPSSSSDGRFVTFSSLAATLVAGDTNAASDIFVHGPPCSDQTIYCTAKINSNGCVPRICSTGRASISNTNQLRITAQQVLNLKSGLFVWGTAPQAAPFFGGTLCVGAPLVRTQPQSSGGTPNTNDCTGSFQFDFTSSYIATSGLALGTHVYGQWWYRDPFLPIRTRVGLSNAVEFLIEP